MTDRRPESLQQSQSDKFKALARELEADEDEGRWNERLKMVAAQKTSLVGKNVPEATPDEEKD